MCDKKYIFYKLEVISEVAPENETEKNIILQAKALLSKYAQDDNLDEIILKRIYDFEQSDTALSIYKRFENELKHFEYLTYNTTASPRNNPGDIAYWRYYTKALKRKENLFKEESEKIDTLELNKVSKNSNTITNKTQNNGSKLCKSCIHYNPIRRNNEGLARCSKHPFWVKENDSCDSYEATKKNQDKEQPKQESKVNERTDESKKTSIIKNLIMFFIFLSLTYIIPVITEYNTCWYWEDYPIECILGVILAVSSFVLSLINFFVLIKKFLIKYKASTAYREKCYKKIDRIYSYLERGSITQNEFDEIKKRILASINNTRNEE